MKPIRIFSLFCVVLLFLSGCQHPPQQPPTMAMPVETLTLKPTTVSEESEFVARMESRHEVILYPRVSAPVTRILVAPGQKVVAGQTLMALDATQQKADVASQQKQTQVYAKNVDQSQETLKASIAEAQLAQSNLDFQNQDLKRYQNLYKVQAASLRQVQQTTNAVTQAQKDVEAHQRQVDAQRRAVESTRRQYQKTLADVQAAQATLGYYTLRAPFAGLVGNIPVKIGDLVNPQTPVSSVTQNKDLEVVLAIPADRAGKVHTGSMVRLVDEEGNTQGTAMVFFVSSNVDQSSQTIVVRAHVIQNNGNLLADQTVRARLVWREKPGLKIPTSTVTNLAGQDFVFLAVQKGGKLTAKQEPVTLGDIVGTEYIVQSGLQQGDVLITSGIQKIHDGAPVQVMTRKPH